jgi:hypothetical protein
LDIELEGARLAIVSLLAVVTDEQFRSVDTALEALAAMSDAIPAALEELHVARAQRPPASGRELATRRAIEARLTMREERG